MVDDEPKDFRFFLEAQRWEPCARPQGEHGGDSLAAAAISMVDHARALVDTLELCPCQAGRALAIAAASVTVQRAAEAGLSTDEIFGELARIIHETSLAGQVAITVEKRQRNIRAAAGQMVPREAEEPAGDDTAR